MKQQLVFTKRNTEAQNNVRASFEVSSLIASRLKPFTDGEFVKDCLLAVVDVVCPEKKSLFEAVSLSARTVTRRIEDLAADVKATPRDRAEAFECYSLALDESTDKWDTAQLAVFVRGVDQKFLITEEFVRLVPLKEKTTGADVLDAVQVAMNDIGLKLGAPSMVGRTNGVVSLMEKVRQDAGATAKLFRSHCIIHQENLCGKSVKMQNVMSVVVKTVNFVRPRGLNHRQFQHLLAEMNAQYQDLLYYCEVRWLSRGAMLRRVYELPK